MSNYFDELESLEDRGFSEIYQLTTFKCYRDLKGGGAQRITLEIFDRGPAHPATRYHVVATREDGKYATGNPSDSLADALRLVHWWVLDQPQDDQELAVGDHIIEADDPDANN